MKLTNKELIEDLKRVGNLLGKPPTLFEYNRYGKYSTFPYKSKRKWKEWLILCFNDDSTEITHSLLCEDDEELRNDLRRVFNIVDRVPSQRDYIKNGKYSLYSFKDWKAFSKETFPDYKKSNSLKIDEQELINDLKRVYILLGKAPSVNDYDRNGKYSISALRRIKNWKAWMKDVFNINSGIACDKISDEDLIDNLLELKEKLGRVPKKDDLAIACGSKYSSNAYKRAFGGLGNALERSGLKVKLDINREAIIKSVQNLCEELGETPFLNKFIDKTGYTYLIIRKMFGSWNKLLIAADIQVNFSKSISQQDVLDALNVWYIKNNKDARSLEYWVLRKAKIRREFPYSCATISNKFEYNLSWENIMKKIDKSYITVDQFVSRGVFLGKDGNTYLSSIEKRVGDLLLVMKGDKIKDYFYEERVCENRDWTCDFKLELNTGKMIWLEIDGMRENRKNPYKSGNNEKIEYYKTSNIDYRIVSYNNSNIKKTLENLLEKI